MKKPEERALGRRASALRASVCSVASVLLPVGGQLVSASHCKAGSRAESHARLSQGHSAPSLERVACLVKTMVCEGPSV